MTTIYNRTTTFDLKESHTDQKEPKQQTPPRLEQKKTTSREWLSQGQQKESPTEPMAFISRL